MLSSSAKFVYRNFVLKISYIKLNYSILPWKTPIIPSDGGEKEF